MKQFLIYSTQDTCPLQFRLRTGYSATKTKASESHFRVRYYPYFPFRFVLTVCDLCVLARANVIVCFFIVVTVLSSFLSLVVNKTVHTPADAVEG